CSRPPPHRSPVPYTALFRSVGTTPKVAYPKPSIGLDAERSAQAVRDGWLSGQPITIPLVESHPATTREELDRLVEELAKPAVSRSEEHTSELQSRENLVCRL